MEKRIKAEHRKERRKELWKNRGGKEERTQNKLMKMRDELIKEKKEGSTQRKEEYD